MKPDKKQVVLLIAELEHLKRLLEDFSKSEINKYFQEVLKGALSMIDKDLRTANDINTVKHLQGYGEGLNYWQLLPEVLIESWNRQIAEAQAEIGTDEEGID